MPSRLLEKFKKLRLRHWLALGFLIFITLVVVGIVLLALRRDQTIDTISTLVPKNASFYLHLNYPSTSNRSRALSEKILDRAAEYFAVPPETIKNYINRELGIYQADDGKWFLLVKAKKTKLLAEPNKSFKTIKDRYLVFGQSTYQLPAENLQKLLNQKYPNGHAWLQIYGDAKKLQNIEGFAGFSELANNFQKITDWKDFYFSLDESLNFSLQGATWGDGNNLLLKNLPSNTVFSLAINNLAATINEFGSELKLDQPNKYLSHLLTWQTYRDILKKSLVPVQKIMDGPAQIIVTQQKNNVFYTLVLPANNESLAPLTAAAQNFLAFRFPSRVKKTLADKTTAIELVAQPESFKVNSTKDGATTINEIRSTDPLWNLVVTSSWDKTAVSNSIKSIDSIISGDNTVKLSKICQNHKRPQIVLSTSFFDFLSKYKQFFDIIAFSINNQAITGCLN